MAAVVVAGLVAPTGVAHAAAVDPPDPVHIVVHTCDEAHLQAAVAATQPNVPARITFDCDGTILATSAAEVVINTFRDVTVDGHGHHVVIDGQWQSQLFTVSWGSKLTLRHLKLTHGHAYLGSGAGALLDFGTAVVDDVTFVDNRAYNFGGAITALGSATLTVNDSRFEANVVTCPIFARGGGAIAFAASGPLTIRDSEFNENSAVGQGSGGAILLRATSASSAPIGNATISNSSFHHNGAIQTNRAWDIAGGGAIAAFGRALTMKDSRFSANHADGANGGAILFSRHLNFQGLPFGPGGPLSISDSSFVDNAANPVGWLPQEGGALSVSGPDPLVIAESTFRRNTAGIAGAMIVSSPLTITDSTLSRNAATYVQPQQVGGIMFLGPHTATLKDTKLLNNTNANCLALFGAHFVDAGDNEVIPAGTCM